MSMTYSKVEIKKSLQQINVFKNAELLKRGNRKAPTFKTLVTTSAIYCYKTERQIFTK